MAEFPPINLCSTRGFTEDDSPFDFQRLDFLNSRFLSGEIMLSGETNRFRGGSKGIAWSRIVFATGGLRTGRCWSTSIPLTLVTFVLGLAFFTQVIDLPLLVTLLSPPFLSSAVDPGLNSGHIENPSCAVPCCKAAAEPAIFGEATSTGGP